MTTPVNTGQIPTQLKQGVKVTTAKQHPARRSAAASAAHMNKQQQGK